MDAKEFAREWVEAWNAHDLDRIVTHYATDVVLTSPVAARITGEASGVARGKDALREYFGKGLAMFPELHFRLLEVLEGMQSVVLYYENQRGTRTAEYMEMDAEGKITRVVANYSIG